ncbi:MAG: hypothetical protein M3024_00005, partial [Candidatus Dormibacteraeota bacterium]|nr:hypothetical protein [Candidatus Dormibacteraeota bacterium]
LSLASRPLLWSGFLLVFAGSTFGPTAAVNIAVAARSHGFAATVATASVVLVATGNTAVRLAGGWASDRVRMSRLLAGLFAVQLAGSVLLFATSHPAPFLSGALLGGLAFGGAGVARRIATEAAPDAANSAFGLIFAGYALAALSGPLAAALAGWPAGWLVVGAPALAGALVLVLTARLRSRPAAT